MLLFVAASEFAPVALGPYVEEHRQALSALLAHAEGVDGPKSPGQDGNTTGHFFNLTWDESIFADAEELEPAERTNMQELERQRPWDLV